MKEEVLQLVQGGTISSLNYSLGSLTKKLTDFLQNFEQSVKAIEQSGGDLEDDEPVLFEQRDALQGISLRTITEISEVDSVMKDLCDLVIPLNALADWSQSNLEDLQGALPSAAEDLKDIYQEVIEQIEKFSQPVSMLKQELLITTEQLKRAKSLLADPKLSNLKAS